MLGGELDESFGRCQYRTVGAGNPWFNGEDVNNDGFVSPIDALIIINKLNTQGEHDLVSPADPLPDGGGYFWDVTNDGTAYLSAADAQQVIDVLNAQAGAAMFTFESLGGQPVPEPTSLLLLLAGGAGVALRCAARKTRG